MPANHGSTNHTSSTVDAPRRDTQTRETQQAIKQQIQPTKEGPSTLPTPGWPRRRFLTLAAVSGVAAATGCRPKNAADVQQAKSSVRTDVPLRLVWTGTDDEAEIVRRTWQSISEQPLKITVAKTDPGDKADFWEQASKTDVLVYPLAQMGELVSRELVMANLGSSTGSGSPTGSSSNSASDEDASTQSAAAPPAIRVAMNFGNESIGKCLGGALPALLLGEQASSDVAGANSMTWSQLQQLAADTPGKVAEPTAPGWAGIAYLWRLASVIQATWLFDRETLEPLLTESDYVDVLQQMADMAKHAPESAMTPGQIFQAVSTGELVAGIGFPELAPQQDAVAETSGSPAGIGNVQVKAMPIADASNLESDTLQLERTGRVMFAPQTLVGSLAESCRQTAAANQFLNWLAGGEGSEPLYRSVGGLLAPSAATGPDDAAGGNYQPWLKSAWQNPNVMPPLNLVGSDRYLQVLDAQARQCLTGQQSAQDACDAISQSWSQLHDEFGVKKQKRSWQKALGLI
ncbi:ABC transporter substrate-binding protein [Rhodopirellula sp. JC740]|uniref:ABC transporter substrate-binding protein n=1 Tax=Rhodopirellula halodulae TaxID=2894198 RepID=A0ABS8NGE3_9BACT|nr:ABC transporter substrate-binding protein [Rhodopirellula sp. JC740]MCC9642608.1 ABC transporter substrate-binding protein [Rhodopirellula sp. JC740]